MGNEQSEFEEQFMQLYRFIGVVEDRLFKQVKVYRKTKFNFDYIMLVELPIAQFALSQPPSQDPALQVTQRLQTIRKYQNGFTATLSYWLLIEGKKLSCEAPVVRMYLEYFNHTLADYLNALRANRLSLDLQELKFVINSLCEGILVLRKMEILTSWLTLQQIWVSADQGKVIINPVLLAYEQTLEGTRSQQLNKLSSEYQPIDLAASHSRFFTPSQTAQSLVQGPQQVQLQNLLQLFLQMTRYLNPSVLSKANQLYKTIAINGKSVVTIMTFLKTDCEELNVDQFGQAKQPTSLYVRKDI